MPQQNANIQEHRQYLQDRIKVLTTQHTEYKESEAQCLGNNNHILASIHNSCANSLWDKRSEVEHTLNNLNRLFPEH